MIEADPPLVEWPGLRRIGELVEAHEGRPHDPHNMAEGSGVLVEHGLRPEQILVPRDAAVEVCDGQRYVGDRGECRHAQPPPSWSTRYEHAPKTQTSLAGVRTT